MWRRKLTEIKTIRVTTKPWKRVAAKNAFRMLGNAPMLLRIIIFGLRVAFSVEALLMNL